MASKILIVDDDPRNIFALSAVLRSRSFVCISCTGARQAIDLLTHDDSIDFVLIDMMMPELDGYEAIPIIRQIPGRENITIVAVTAQAMTGDREKCIAAGADDYIAKPVNVDRLIEILHA